MTDSAGDISLGLEAIKGFSGKLTQAILGFAGTIVFARVLGPTSFGGFYFLLTLVYVADRPLRGMSQAVRKRYSEENTEKQEILGTILLVVTALSAVMAALVFVFGDLLVAETNVEAAPLVFFLLFVSIGLFTNFENTLSAAGLPARQIWSDTARSVLTLGLQLVFVLSGFGAAGMGYGLASATLLTVPVVLYFIGVRPRTPSRKTIKSLWDYAKYSIPSSYVGVAYNRLDILLLGFFLTTGVVGQYQVAMKLTIPATLVSSAVSVAFMPKVSNLASQEEDVTEDIENALSYNSILAIPILFGAMAISTKLIVTVYGGDYRAAAPFLIGLAAYQLLFTQKKILSETISGLDRPDIGLRINAGTFLFNVVIGIALLFTIGAIGVVIATVIAELLAYGASLYMARQLAPDFNPFPRTLLEQTGASLVMFAAVEGLTRIISIQNWFGLLLVVGFGILVYGGVLLLVSRGLRVTLRSVYRDAVL